MKLLHVIGSMNPHTGGPCQTIRNFAPEFIGRGNKLDVVCLDDPGSEFLKRDTFPVRALGQGRGSWNYHPALLPWLTDHLGDYDAAILNGLWQYQGYALWKAAKRLNYSRYYIFPHGMLDPWFQKLTVRPVKAMRNWLIWKAIMQHVVNDAAGLLFTSDEERRLARVPFRPYAPKQEAVVGLGLPEPPPYHAGLKQAFHEKCPAVNGDQFFLFLSRIDPKKGVDLLIKSYAALMQSPQKSTAPKLVIAGPGLDTPYGQKMAKLAEEICPPGSVLWPGMLAGDAKWGALSLCDSLVLPSHQENYGIAVVEALACGRPVLISDQVNIWREIKDSGAAMVEGDTLEGTTRMLMDWTKLAPSAKSEMAGRTKDCFQNYFSIKSATCKLLAATNSASN